MHNDDTEKTLAPLCTKGHVCRKKPVYCRPAYPIDVDSFYFVGQGDEDCSYRKNYGGLHTCTCPLRLEIYLRYKI